MKLSKLPIPKRVTDVALSTGKTLLDKAAFAFNAADEWGGEARDFIAEKIEASPRARKTVDNLMDRFRKQDKIKDRLDDVESGRRKIRMSNEANQAPPPTAAELAAIEARQGLGDPTIKAQIYGRTSCPWTGRAITLLEKQKIDYDYINMDDPEFEHFMPKLVGETKQNTVPYVFLRGEFVGGFNALDEVNRLGQLDERIKPKAERKEQLEVAKRPNTDETAPAEISSPS